MKKLKLKNHTGLNRTLTLLMVILLSACQSDLNNETGPNTSINKANGADRDIKLKFFLGDRGLGNDIGEVEGPGWAADKQNQWSEWGGDEDLYDPDWIVIELVTRTIKNLKNLDFRIAIQLSDKHGTSGIGSVRYTPWASQGGGWSLWATDSDQYDFDAVRFKIETRPYSGFTVEDVRFGIQLTDHGTSVSHRGVAQYTPWLSQGGGRTNYAGDKDFYDPDAIRIKLDIIR